MNKWHKSIIIGLSAVIISTLGIQASDLLRGVEGNLSGLVNDSAGPCGSGAIKMLLGSGAICIDIYEASPNSNCVNKNPLSPPQTQENLNDSDCHVVSESGVKPWRFISFTQSQQMCARTGKRLATPYEWYKAVSGLTEINKCAIDLSGSSPQETGKADCVSPLGVNDLVGNVWEWVEAEVKDGIYENRAIPDSGYVTSVDNNGVVVETSDRADENFGADYAWTNQSGVYAMIRGGYYGSDEDAGIFSQNLSMASNIQTAGVGFRCVKDI